MDWTLIRTYLLNTLGLSPIHNEGSFPGGSMRWNTSKVGGISQRMSGANNIIARISDFFTTMHLLLLADRIESAEHAQLR